MSSDCRGLFQAFTWVLCANSRSCFLTSAQPSSSSCLGQKSSFGSRLDITSSPSTDPTAPHDWCPSHLDPQHWNLSSPSAQTSPGCAAPPGSPSPSANPGSPPAAWGCSKQHPPRKSPEPAAAGLRLMGTGSHQCQRLALPLFGAGIWIPGTVPSGQRAPEVSCLHSPAWESPSHPVPASGRKNTGHI